MSILLVQITAAKGRKIMQDKKMNVLDRILCVFKPKKEFPEDIITQADKVIENYIYCKNKLIHRKCSKSRRSEHAAVAIVFIVSAAFTVMLLKTII